jgi:ribosomal protein S18 acetylase RimI-like enzyme
MTAAAYRSAPLGEDGDLEPFDSGVPALDEWLRRHARQAQRHGLARTTLWHDAETDAVVGYYALCVTSIQREDVTRRYSSGVTVVPGFMIAKLALAKTLHGRGLGEQLLLDALETVCAAAERIAGRVVVVDPVDDVAAGFYARYGFWSVGESTRMYLLVSEARAALGAG